MSDEDKKKPLTLEDYIPSEPAPVSSRRKPSKRDKARLEALEKDLSDTDKNTSTQSNKRKRSRANQRRSGKNFRLHGLVFWAIVIMMFAVFVLD